MDWYQAIVLAIIQGLTEFLPISSSAHLILPSTVLGWDDQGLAFDVAVHVGSLTAVVCYFWKDLKHLSYGGLLTLKGEASESGRLAWLIVTATVPVVIAGFIFEDFVEQNLRSTQTIAIATLIGALILGFADRFASADKVLTNMTVGMALAIGIAQVFALIPGTSRSGITMTMALLLGFGHVAAARFSFLLAIPVIVAGGVWQGLALAQEAHVPWALISVATIVSGLSAYACIHYFLKLIQVVGMMPFVIYRLVLGVILLVLVS